MLIGYGLSACILDPILVMVINPWSYNCMDNKYPPEVDERFPMMIRILVLILGFYTVVGVALIFKGPPSPTENLQESENESLDHNRSTETSSRVASEDISSQSSQMVEVPVSTMDMVKSRQFAVLYVMAISTVYFGMFTMGAFKGFGIINNIPESFLVIVATIGAFCNSLRFIWGMLLDKFSFKAVYAGICLI